MSLWKRIALVVVVLWLSAHMTEHAVALQAHPASNAVTHGVRVEINDAVLIIHDAERGYRVPDRFVSGKKVRNPSDDARTISFNSVSWIDGRIVHFNSVGQFALGYREITFEKNRIIRKYRAEITFPHHESYISSNSFKFFYEPMAYGIFIRTKCVVASRSITDIFYAKRRENMYKIIIDDYSTVINGNFYPRPIGFNSRLPEFFDVFFCGAYCNSICVVGFFDCLPSGFSGLLGFPQSNSNDHSADEGQDRNNTRSYRLPECPKFLGNGCIRRFPSKIETVSFTLIGIVFAFFGAILFVWLIYNPNRYRIAAGISVALFSILLTCSCYIMALGVFPWWVGWLLPFL